MSSSDYSDAVKPNPPESNQGGQASGAHSANVNTDAVQRAKREIQAIIQQIGELSRSDITPDHYYEEFLKRVVSALAAVGGAVWTVSETGVLQLAYQINLRETGLVENPIAQEQHGRLLQRVLISAADGDRETDGDIVAPRSGFSSDGSIVGADADEHAPANATDFLLVLAPMHNDQGAQGVVEIFQRSGARQQVQQGYLRFLRQTCELAGDYLRSRRLSLLADKQSLWEQLESFTRTAHEELDVRKASYTIANEGRRLIGADRVTVAVGRGSRPRIEAISGQDTFDRRSNTTSLLQKLARAVTKTGEDVWYTGDTTNFAPQVEKAIDAYVDESQTKAMAILPLIERRGEAEADAIAGTGEELSHDNRAGEVLGALIVEQMVDSSFAEGFEQRVDVVRSHSTTAIANALEHEGIFLMPLWKALGKSMWIFRRRTLPKTILIGGTIIGLALAAFLVQKDFMIEGDGKLRPVSQRNVFASIDGQVKKVFVEHEQQVRAGQTLVELESIDLDKELNATRGQLEELLAEKITLGRGTHGNELTEVEKQQRRARIAKINKQLLSVEKELELLDKKQDLLTVKSPIAGQVITWQVEQQLHDRPVSLGSILMEIADPSGEWIVEVDMPERRLGHISEALRESEDGTLDVTFFLATTTEKTFSGKLTNANVASSAEVRGEEGNTVLLRVIFDQEEFRQAITNPKVGAEVRAKVACGHASIAYAYLHDLVDFIRAKILFRF